MELVGALRGSAATLLAQQAAIRLFIRALYVDILARRADRAPDKEKALFPAPFSILELNDKSAVTALCYAHENLSSSQQKAPSLILGIAYRGKVF